MRESFLAGKTETLLARENPFDELEVFSTWVQSATEAVSGRTLKRDWNGDEPVVLSACQGNDGELHNDRD